MNPIAPLENKTILLVHAGSIRKKFILERLKQLQVHIICLHKERADWAEAYVDEWIIADPTNEEACVEKVKQFFNSRPAGKPNGVFTFWDECVLLTAKISDEFGLPGIPLAVAERIKNKNAFREACQAVGIAAPRHVLLRQSADVALADQLLTYPLVVKPVYGACSAFVVRVDNRAELTQAFATITKNIHSFWLAPEWNNLEVLVEEYIDGQEVDIDILLQDGVAKFVSIIDNKKTHEPFFVETGWSSPSALSNTAQHQLKHMALATLATLGVKNGCIHFEAKIGRQGAVPIEVNLRMGGGEIYLYAKEVWNADLVEGAAKIACGIMVEVAAVTKPQCHLLSYRFLSDTSCVIDDITVNDALYREPGLVEVYFEKQVGDMFLAPPDGYDRSIGVITVKGTSAENAQHNLITALRHIRCHTQKIPSLAHQPYPADTSLHPVC